MSFSIYYIVDNKNPENIYVGKTSQHITIRLVEHYQQRNKDEKISSAMSRYMKDRNFEDFDIYCIENNLSKDNVSDRENYWINEMSTLNIRASVINTENRKNYKKKFSQTKVICICGKKMLRCNWYTHSKKFNHNEYTEE